MAEDDPSGLERLIQQRKNRPSYARMISWEIAKSSGDPPPKSGKNQPKNVAPGPDEENAHEGESEEVSESSASVSESSDSEYFSADEVTPLHSESEEEQRSTNKTCADCSSPLTVSGTSTYTSEKERGRGRNKRQKKKRRAQRKEGKSDLELYEDYTAPFHHEDQLTFSLSDMREQVVNRVDNVPTHVPSLFDLCCRTIWTKSRSPPPPGLHLLPGPVKRTGFAQQQTRALSTLQLSCFYRDLAQIESQLYDRRLRVMRSVWSKNYAVRMPECDQLDWHFQQVAGNGAENKDTIVIPYMYACYGLPDHEKCSRLMDTRTKLYHTSLLVSVLDLMAPSHLSPPRGKAGAAATLQEADRMLASCAEVILNNLVKRYPNTVRELRHKALAYFYWLRGHSRLALELFIQQSQATGDVLDKACCLLEAALLCQLQQKGEATRKLIQQSHELLLDKPSVRGSDSGTEQVNEQRLALCANTYDQGVLSQETALKALTAWQSLMSFPCQPLTAGAAAEAILCYHLNHLPGGDLKSKVELVMAHVTRCAQVSRRLWLHLSLLHAWLGQRPDSITAYNRMMIISESPGQQFKPSGVLNSAFTPWQMVCEAVKSQQTPLSPLTVVWRTQLGHFRIVTDLDVFYGQQQARFGQLRVSPEGHLTDDLHLVLPPIRAVNLDLYTGKLIVPSSTAEAQVNKSFFKSCFSSHDSPDVQLYANGSYAMTSTELYSDDSGTQLHLLTRGGLQVLGTSTCMGHLQYMSAQGHRSKLNIKQLLMKQLRMHVEREISARCSVSEDVTTSSSEDHKIALEGLEYACVHSLYISTHTDALNIGRLLAQSKNRKLYKNRKFWKSKGWRITSDPKGELKAKKQLEFQMNDFVRYGRTVFLRGTVNGKVFFLFVDTSSKESFSRPVVVCPAKYDSQSVCVGRQGDTVPRSDILCFVHATEKSVYGQGGRRLMDKSVDLSPQDCQCVLGSSVYYIENLTNRQAGGTLMLTELRYEQQQEEVVPAQIFVYDLDPEMQGLKTAGDRLLLVRSDGLRVLSPDTMLPEPLIHDHSRSGQWPCQLSGDCTTVLVSPGRVTVLPDKTVLPSGETRRVLVPVAVNDCLLMLSIQERTTVADSVVEVSFCVRVPGHTTELCCIGHSTGYLISTTLHQQNDRVNYRETVCRLGSSGQLLSILPCVGPGPHGFCPVLLPPPPPLHQDRGEKGEGEKQELPVWHVYMRDGHEGIIAVRL